MLVCLDLDNTLNDRQAAVSQWIDEFVRANGLPPEEWQWLFDLDEDGYRPRHQAFAEIRVRYGLSADVDSLVETYRERVIELARPLEGATDCLEQLRVDGHALVILSNGSSEQQHRKIDGLGFRELVDAVIVSGDLGIKKPDPRIFEAAARAVGSAVEGAWMVGDAMLHDVVGGARCGMRTAWVRRGREWDDALEARPDVVVDGLDRLAPLLANGVA
ncbi:MAG: HAD family hydrolase [Actinomycetota bacterium]